MNKLAPIFGMLACVAISSAQGGIQPSYTFVAKLSAEGPGVNGWEGAKGQAKVVINTQAGSTDVSLWTFTFTGHVSNIFTPPINATINFGASDIAGPCIFELNAPDVKTTDTTTNMLSAWWKNTVGMDDTFRFNCLNRRQLLGALLAGRMYFEVYTVGAPGGSMRGNFVQQTTVTSNNKKNLVALK